MFLPALLSRGPISRDAPLGLTVRNTSEEDLKRYNIESGVTVISVRAQSPAASSGIQSGDVITLIGTAPIRDKEAFSRIVKLLPLGKSVPIRLIRQGSHLFIGLKVPQ